ncbi:MAG TPA: DUF4191 domain-containing protein [Pseudonocardiaceae bacterium]|jgi:hypothetical protein|nr:DUF4191 domain-containing protein [Pseudonocardiaceae bacterium]
MAGKQDKSAAKEAAAARKAARRGKFTSNVKNTYEAFKLQRREDKLLLPLIIGAFVLPIVVAVVVALVLDLTVVSLVSVIVLGVLVGVLLGFIIFVRRAQRSMFARVDGQPGAAAWVLDQLRGTWRVSQSVAGTTQLDAVHRVIGKPGVILVAEGAPHRVKGLLAQEKKRMARVIGNTPIYDVIVGNEEGQIELSKLQRHIMRLPSNINAGQVDTLEARLGALASRGAALPKGPLPPGAKMRSVQRAIRRR